MANFMVQLAAEREAYSQGGGRVGMLNCERFEKIKRAWQTWAEQGGDTPKFDGKYGG